MASLSFSPVVGLTGRVDPRLFSRACCRTRASPTRCLCLYPIVPHLRHKHLHPSIIETVICFDVGPFLSISYTTQTIRRESDYWILPIARFPRLHTSVAALACLFLTQLRSFPTYPCRSISPQVCIPTFSACVPRAPPKPTPKCTVGLVHHPMARGIPLSLFIPNQTHQTRRIQKSKSVLRRTVPSRADRLAPPPKSRRCCFLVYL